MATRIYVPSATRTVFITPPYETFHDDTSIMTRTIGLTTKQPAAARTLSFVDVDATDKDIGFLQVISRRMTPGQTIGEGIPITASVQVEEATDSCNLFLTFGLRVVGGDGVTTNKTLLSMTRDDVEAPGGSGSLASRRFDGLTAAGDYTTVDGDRLVAEFGMGGDPVGAGSHSSSMRLGGIFKTDLTFVDGDTADRPSWFELTATLTFLPDATILIPGKTVFLGKVTLK